MMTFGSEYNSLLRSESVKLKRPQEECIELPEHDFILLGVPEKVPYGKGLVADTVIPQFLPLPCFLLLLT
jgi:hypothetical protein